MKKHLLFLFAALSPLLANAQTKVEIDGIWYNLNAGTMQAEVTYQGSSHDEYAGEYTGSITIPTTITHNGVNYNVTSIGDYAFWDCTSLNSIIFPENSQLTNIGEHTFTHCTNITNITLPEGVTNIGNSAFNWCTGLTDINIPKSVTSIGGGAFNCCRNLSEITIPEGVTNIEYSTFQECTSLTNIIIPEGVTSIQDDAFRGCISLTNITIPESVTNICFCAFQGCTSLTDVYCYAEAVPSPDGYIFPGSNIEQATLHVPANALNDYKNTAPWSSFGNIVAINGINGKVEIDGIWYNLVSKAKQAEVTSGNTEYIGDISIPSTVTYEGVQYCVTSIGSDAFAYCDNLTKAIIPEGVTSIGNNAFSYCYNLTAITIPASVTSIGNSAFSCCRKLTAITIPESMTSIGGYAFHECSSLTAITIPESVTNIGNGAFSYCNGLTTINVVGNNTIYDSRGGCNAIIETATNTLISGCTTTTIPKGVTSIGDMAFFGYENLTAITIPMGVVSIGDKAFCNCYSLKAIVLPESVTSIGNDVFSGCLSLTDISLSDGLTSIGYSAFSVCRSLTTIVIPESVTRIGQSAFYWCSSLAEINIPKNVTSIEMSTFNGCYNLTDINIPESIRSIEYEAFYGCSSLTNICIPEGVTEIGKGAFSSCSNLTTIALPKSLEYINSEAFADCFELINIYCSAETVPTTKIDAFKGSFPEYATLHVPAVALNAYKSTAPWSSFGTINSATNEPVQSITLNRQSVTITEGNTLTLTATITPIYATDRSLTWSSSNTSVATVDNGKVTAVAPGTATITATANDGSGVSASCEVTVTEATYVKITINQYGSGTYSSEYDLDFRQVTGLKAYVATGYNPESEVVTLLRVNTAKAGVGLLIKGAPGTYEVPIMETSNDNTLNLLVATRNKTSVDAYSSDRFYANYKYTIKEDDTEPKFYQFADGSTMGAGKAYLQIPTAWLPTNAARSIGLRFDDGEDTTDIEDAEFNAQHSAFIYDLYGRRVTQPVKGAMYIVNGRKVVF